jgi:AcrR family transcriptional regulator
MTDMKTAPSEAPGKRAVLAAALALFAEKGIDATSIRDIGAAAGLTNPAMFRHFPGKEALALHLFERIFRRFRSTLPAIDGEPFDIQLRRTVAAFLAFCDEDPGAALYFQENLRRLWPQLPDALRKQSLLAYFHALLKVGVAQGVVSADDDPRLLITVLAGVLGQFARQLYYREIAGPAGARLDDLHRLILRSLVPGPSAIPE